MAHVEGDDILDRLGDLQAGGDTLAHLDTGRPLAEAGTVPVSANAYLGGFGIAHALAGGADVVVTGRVTDVSLVVGPAAWRFGWSRTDWDRLAGAVVVGHIIECGTQTTGGNYAFFGEVPGLEHPGFPVAEVSEDGSAVITKHPGTGGLVSVGTVMAQLLYEIGGPLYANPDVVADFSTIDLEDLGHDRVRVSGVRGRPAPEKLKVSINLPGGWRNTMTFVLTGLDIEEKASLVRRTMDDLVGGAGVFSDYDTRLIRTDVPDVPSNEQASAQLRITVKSHDAEVVGRRFSSAATELALASYPGFYLTSPPGDGTAFGVFWPALVARTGIDEVVVHDDGRREVLPPAPIVATDADRDAPPDVTDATADGDAAPPTAVPPADGTRRVALGTVIGARSGDKGGNANVGLWARTPAAFAWLARTLTVARLPRSCPRRPSSRSTATSWPTCCRSISWCAASWAKAWPRPPAPTRKPRAWASTCAHGSSRFPRRSSPTCPLPTTRGDQWTSLRPTNSRCCARRWEPSPRSTGTATSRSGPATAGTPTSCGTSWRLRGSWA